MTWIESYGKELGGMTENRNRLGIVLRPQELSRYARPVFLGARWRSSVSPTGVKEEEARY